MIDRTIYSHDFLKYMHPAKRPVVALRVAPDVKAALERAAREHLRPVSGLVVWLAVAWLKRRSYLPRTPESPAAPNGKR